MSDKKLPMAPVGVRPSHPADTAGSDFRKWEATYKEGAEKPLDPPSRFVMECLPALGKPGRALDLAMGEGRHALALAAAGWDVVGLDISPTVAARVRGRGRVHAVVADARTFPLKPSSFDLIVCTRFLERELAGPIAGALAPGGHLIFETFTTDQPKLGWGARNPAYLLAPNELLRLFSGLRAVRYSDEISPEGALARLLARREPSP